MGASGALSTTACALTMRDGLLPASAGREAACPECELNVVLDTPRTARPEFCLVNTTALGGINASLIIAAA